MSQTFEFSDEQAMLAETAANFCREKSTIDQVRAELDAKQHNATLWQEITELGWLGINVPEAYGGLELGLASVVPIVENMGRYLTPSPYLYHVLACEALESSASETQKSTWFPKLVEGAIATMALTEPEGSWQLDQPQSTASLEDDKIKLSGQKCFVTDADCAEFIVASVKLEGATRLVVIRGDQLPESALERETVIDQTRRSFQLSLDNINVDADQLLPEANLESVERAALLLISAEMTGGIAGVLPLIVDYLQTRKTFGRYIGSYQSMKHPTVQILIGLEGAKSHLYHAATVLSGDDTSAAEIAVRMAKAHSSEAFAFAGDRAVQFHGGMGFTFECDAQLFLRRALWCQYQFGDERHQRQSLAALLLDQAS